MEKIYEVLKDKTVGICGVGGLGSNIATLLTRMGIGRLILADDDIVEKKNLNRQNFFENQIGEKKVVACQQVLSKINQSTKIDVHDCRLTPKNIKKIYKDVDIIIEAFDLPKEKAMLSNFVLSQMPDKYLIGASGIAGYESNNTIKTRRIKERFYLVGDLKSTMASGMYGPRVNIVASMQANMAIRLLMGVESI